MDFKIWGRYQKTLYYYVEIFVDWLANNNPPWEAYCAFMSGRLITLEKQPVVCPINVGETWRCLFAKCVLKVTGHEATNAYHDDQSCERLKAGIDGAGPYTAFKLFGTLNRPQKIGIFYLSTQYICSTKKIALEYCGQFTIYCYPELVLF